MLSSDGDAIMHGTMGNVDRGYQLLFRASDYNFDIFKLFLVRI
jgi:hypothetical protein